MENTLYTAGDYIILKHEDPYINTQQFFNFTEKYFDGGTGTIIKRSFRYSFDKSTFSEYVDLTPENLSKIEPKENVWFNFRYLLLSGGPFSIRELLLQYSTIETIVPGNSVYQDISTPSTNPVSYPVSYFPGFLWNPYEMGQAVRLYKDLNLMINNLFGHEIWYYRHTPIPSSKDIFLMEYTLYNNEPKQCIKVVVPQNQFPDNKISLGPYGGGFDQPFEIHIDKDYFQAIFGAGSGPQEKDVLYFPVTQRIYEIESAYLFRDFMNVPLYHKILIKKWNPKHDTNNSTDLNDLKSFTKSADTIFGLSQLEEGNKVTNLQQFTPSTKVYDPIRARIENNFVIYDEVIKNYNLDISEHYYSLQSFILPNSNITLSGTTYNFIIGNTYFIRNFNSSASNYPDLQYLYSIKKLKCLGFIGSDFKFEIIGGESQIQRTISINQIFNTVSPYILYDREFTVENNNDGLIANCSDLSIIKTIPEVVTYKANTQVLDTEDRCYTAWFRLKQNISNSFSCNVTIDNKNIFKVITNKPHNFINGDKIGIKRNATSNFLLIGTIIKIDSSLEILIELDRDILNYTFKNLPSWEGYTDFKIFKTEERVFIDSTFNTESGMKIFLYENIYFKVQLNNTYYLFSTSLQELGLEMDKWFSIVVNISNNFKQLSLNIWERQWDQVLNTPATNELKIRVKGIYEISPIHINESEYYYITASNTDITNIRIYKSIIETDKQSVILNQQIVKDANNAIIIDNALPLLDLPKLGYTR